MKNADFNERFVATIQTGKLWKNASERVQPEAVAATHQLVVREDNEDTEQQVS